MGWAAEQKVELEIMHGSILRIHSLPVQMMAPDLLEVSCNLETLSRKFQVNGYKSQLTSFAPLDIQDWET